MSRHKNNILFDQKELIFAISHRCIDDDDESLLSENKHSLDKMIQCFRIQSLLIIK